MNPPRTSETPPRILFVDDSADDILLASDALRRDGLAFEPTIAASLDEAHAALDRGGWSLIISDYNLGAHTGIEVLHIARAAAPDVPFILLSGTVGEERAVEAIRMGAVDYVMKDRLGRLAPAVRRELEGADARRTRAALEARLRSAEERYRKTVERAPVGIANSDTNGVFLSVNARFCEILGHTEEELLGRPFNEFSFDEDSTAALTHFKALVAGDVPTARYERRYVRKDGLIAWADVTLAAVRDGHGAIEYVIGLVEDITARKDAHEKLLLQTRLLDCVEQSVVATDLQGRIVYWNAYAERKYGWTAAEAIGQNLGELTASPEDETVPTNFMARVRNGESWTGQVMMVRRDGSTFPAVVIDAPLYDDRGTLVGLVGVSSDITEQKRVENELRNRTVQLAKLAQQQSAIAEMGRLVLTSVENEVFERACELLMYGTDADYAYFAELTGDNVLRARAGRFWADTLPGELAVGSSTQTGATFRDGVAIVVNDYRTEGPELTRQLTVPYGVLSGVMVPVASATRSYGILSAQSRTAGAFRHEDTEFMQSLANILAEAMERENARLTVAESEHRYRRIFNGATEIIFSLDTAGCFLTLNSAFETITGWERTEWLGRPFQELIAPEDRERIAAIVADVLDRQRPVNESTTLLGRDRRIDLEVSSFVRTENETVSEIYGFARDVTEARRVSAERETLTRNLQLLLESTVEGIYTLDLEGRCTMVNRAAAAFIGRAPEDILGRSMHDLLHAVTVDGRPNPAESCVVHGVLRDGEPRTVTSDFFSHEDGRLIPVAYSAAAILDDGRRLGAVVTFIDLSERRKLEAKLEQANRLSSLGRLAATVAHEFNNVLMSVAPFVEVIRRSPSPQKISDALDHIGSAVKRGRRITEDILRFTQPAQPVRTAVDLDVWLQAIGVEARSLLGASYTVTVDALPLSIEADANQLHQIFMNLILNARDAMPGGGEVTLSARTEPDDARFPFGALDHPGRYAHLIARDCGSGMSEETLRHAFEPLFTTKHNGTGLGLAVTHQVVRQHGGDIFIESAPGAGTTFHIFLPLGNVSPALQIAEAAGELPEGIGSSEVLLVDDDLLVSIGLRALLEAEGFSVRSTHTGKGALDALVDGLPAAVVLDVGLPDMDGQDVYAAIAAQYPSLPVVFSTGHTDRGVLEALLALPHVTYLRKPYEGSALMEALARVMAV